MNDELNEGINLANLVTNMAQLEMMQRQLERDRETQGMYFSTMISLLTEIRNELRTCTETFCRGTIGGD